MDDILTRLLTRKTALAQSRLQTEPLGCPTPGEALLKIDRLALTTNNVTYAAFGDAMRYWDFFPSPDAGWGHMPAWGFADVLATSVPDVEVGERFYGYWPIASHLRVQPVRVSERGFHDGSPHRRELVSAYNQYTRCSHDPVYDVADENLQMLLRPLFITSFMLADFLCDNAFFGASRLVVSSASSKTAYGTAFCLQDDSSVEVVALTSERNKSFVAGLGCYARTLAYDELASLDAKAATLYVDFSGDNALRERIHRHFGDALVHDCYAGSAQNTEFLGDTDLPGPKPALYFAPVQIKKRNIDWGPAVVNERFGEAQRRFIRRVGDPASTWLRVQEHVGFGEAQQLVEQLVAGRADPLMGHVVRL